MKASDFCDYYRSNGWRVGSNPMTDWKAAVRTWARREKEKRDGGLLPAQNYSQRDYSGEQEALIRQMMEDYYREQEAECLAEYRAERDREGA